MERVATMKKIFTIISLIIFSLPVFSFEEIQYKNLKNNCKIKYSDKGWSSKINRKKDEYFIKKQSKDLLNFSEFYSPTGDFSFSTETNYEFLHKGSLIGYSNSNLKFYEIWISEGSVQKRELLEEEVQELFPKYKIVKILNFSETNAYKLKKDKKTLKMILLNNTEKSFDNYWFTTNNADIKHYKLKGFLDIEKKGMIQFSRSKDSSGSYPWYVLLIR